jgi:hypothetical protein
MKTCSHLWQYVAKFFLEWENVLDKSCRENQKLFSENVALYEIMSKNVLEPEGPQMTSRHDAYDLNVA